MVLASKSPEKIAMIMAMSVSGQMPLADVKNRLSEVVDRLEREHGRVVITKHGPPLPWSSAWKTWSLWRRPSTSWAAPRS
jgi:hypothetical protein